MLDCLIENSECQDSVRLWSIVRGLDAAKDEEIFVGRRRGFNANGFMAHISLSVLSVLATRVRSVYAVRQDGKR